MNGFGFIAGGTGLQDGLNPCMFMTCAVFIAYGLWLKKISLRPAWLRVIFVVTYISGFMDFNFGRAQVLVLNKEFFLAAKILYFILGAGAFIFGLLFFRDWVLLRRGLLKNDLLSVCHCEEPAGRRSNLFRAISIRVITIMVAMLLSALATTWPINNYIMLLGNLALLKGQWQAVMPVLLGYVLVSMWPLWFVWAILSIKDLKPSMLKIFCASIFLTASSCMILIFK